MSQLAAGLSHAGQCQAVLPSSRVLEEVLLLVGTPGWDVGDWEPPGTDCAGSQPDTCHLQVGRSPSTTPARARTPLPKAPVMRPTWRTHGMPSRSWVLSWLGTGGEGVGRAGPQGWLSHHPHPAAGEELLVPDTPVLGTLLSPAIPIALGCVMQRFRPAWVGGAWEVPHAWVVTAGVPEDEQLELYSILAAILHLGNIVVRGRDRRGDGCFVEVGDNLLPAPHVPNCPLSCAGCRSHISAMPW